MQVALECPVCILLVGVTLIGKKFNDYWAVRLYVKSQDPFFNVFQIGFLQFHLGPKFIQERNQHF